MGKYLKEQYEIQDILAESLHNRIKIELTKKENKLKQEVQMKQITIYDLLPLLKKGWIAMDKNSNWWWYSHKPVSGFLDNCWHQLKGNAELLCMFKIKKFKGDWKDSLIKVEYKEEK